MRAATTHLEISQLQRILRYVFALVPIAAGADKFFNLLADWEVYVPPFLAEMLPFSTPVFMMIVGVIEIAAGVLVLIRPRIGAYVVSAWLVLIALNLIISGDHLDVAVRDLVMAVAAFVLARLTEITEAGISPDRAGGGAVARERTPAARHS